MQKGLVTDRPRLISRAQKVAQLISSIFQSLSPTLVVRLGRLRRQIFGSFPATSEACTRTDGSPSLRELSADFATHSSHFTYGRIETITQHSRVTLHHGPYTVPATTAVSTLL